MTKKTLDLYNFYALSGSTSEPCIHRVAVDRKLQQELTTHFEVMRSAFKRRYEEAVPYDPGNRPDTGEHNFIKDFTFPDAITELLTPQVSQHPSISGAALESGDVHALLGVDPAKDPGKAFVGFQSIDSRQVIRREGWTFLLNDDVFRRNDSTGIVIRDTLDAILEEGRLCFTSEFVVRRFLDLNVYFEDATDDVVETFLKTDAFHVIDQAQVLGNLDQWSRRRITMLASSPVLKLGASNIVRHAKKFSLTFATAKGKLVVPTDKKEFKNLLRFLSEDFVESEMTGTKYLSNSKRKL